MLEEVLICLFRSQIIVLENGVVTEQGPHDVLLAKNGRYAQLWYQQTFENENVTAISS